MGEGGGLAWAPIAVPPLAAAAGGGDDGRRRGAWRAPAVAGGELPGRPHARATQGRGGLCSYNEILLTWSPCHLKMPLLPSVLFVHHRWDFRTGAPNLRGRMRSSFAVARACNGAELGGVAREHEPPSSFGSAVCVGGWGVGVFLINVHHTYGKGVVQAEICRF
jgi:hypothetical protein